MFYLLYQEKPREFGSINNFIKILLISTDNE